MLVRGNKGFTLIELLIVIAIIVILAAVLIPNLLGARNRATITAAVAELRSLSTALETYMLDNGQFPPDGEVGPNSTFVTTYLNNKDPRWPFARDDRILANYTQTDDGTSYIITRDVPTNLVGAARSMMGGNGSRISLTPERGVQLIP